MAERIDRAGFEEKVLKSGETVLVEFYSDSCAACKMISPSLAEAEETYGNRLKVYKINTNYEAELAKSRDVAANPTLVIFRMGIEQERKTGVIRKPELFAWIEQFLDRKDGE